MEKKNFTIVKEQFDLTKEQLNQLEIDEIAKEDSYHNGFNLTLGGEGGNTRGSLTFDQYCFAYFGNKKYKWLCARTGKYLGVDGSIISSIAREQSYLWYKEKALKLSEAEQNAYIEKFEKELDILNNPPKPIQSKLTAEQIIDFLSVVSTYGRGAEAAMTRYLGISKGLKNHLIKGEYSKEVQVFSSLSDKEIEQRAIKLFEEQNLQHYCTQKISKNKAIMRPI